MILKKFIKKITFILDPILFFFLFPSAVLLKHIRHIGLHRLPICKKALLAIGVIPVRNHYHEPFVGSQHLTRPLDKDRHLPGINWNEKEQLEVLGSFSFMDELDGIPLEKIDDLTFYMNNASFGAGDAEYWYHLIRIKKPSTVIEVGSGNSTLVASRALQKNKEETPECECKHICIEPYENQWLDRLGNVTVIRKKIEEIGVDFFAGLGANDILFIDSTHVIRPQGDVLFEYLELLPSLRPGVIVHIHDIFSPKDYLERWVIKEMKLWNEQYLLEAFLTSNQVWKIIGAVNYLHHRHYEKLREKCPFLTVKHEPGSFYIQKIVS